MPEGPSIVIAREILEEFIGKKIQEATGNAKIDMGMLTGEKIADIKSYGKHLLICLPAVTIRIHFLLFGSYSVGTQTKPDKGLRLHLHFTKGDLFFYTCSVKLIEGDLDKLYEWDTDVLNPAWDAAKALRKLKLHPGMLICDALLDQDIFAGVGNIIKNEVLYRVRVHPESVVGKIPVARLKEIIKEASNYSFDFLKWKKAFELKKHWLVHTKKECPNCHGPIVKKYLGKTNRRTFFCNNCQVKYA